MQAEEEGGLGATAELGPAHLRVKAAGLKREAADLEVGQILNPKP
jgi:hypothetical protein